MLALTLTLAQVALPAPPMLKPTPYAEARARVEKGDKVILLVKPPATVTRIPTRPGWTTLRSDDVALAPGRYDCQTHDGRPCMTQVETYLPVPQTAEDWRWFLTPPGCTTSR